MPPVTSPGSQPRNSSDLALSRIRFRRALTLMVMTLLLPGSAQIATGNKQVGRIALRVWLGTIGAGVVPAPRRPDLQQLRLLADEQQGHARGDPAST